MEEKDPFLCKKCQGHLSISTIHPDDAVGVCAVCMGLWENEDEGGLLNEAIASACEPYGGLHAKSNLNRFAKLPNHCPTVSISGDIYTRYQWMSKSSNSATPFSVFQQDLKQHLQKKIQRILHTVTIVTELSTEFANEEEQGYLGIHILCLPPKDMKTNQNDLGKKRKRQRNRPFTTQGGHPQDSLEARLLAEGYNWQTMSQAESSNPATQKPQETSPMEYHVAVYRRPIFMYGYYTKARRDVSQTPFVVDGKTLGVTSVEEEICGPVVKMLGVSTHNNLPSGSVQYGMCKFHASGREDLDVRMLLRPNTKGRPFCVQIIDALRPIESQEQLQTLVDTINQGTGENSQLWYGQNPLGVGISSDFRIVPSKAFSSLQAETETKVKHYGCHCWSEQELPNDWTLPPMDFPLTIQQKTPLRVLHRRVNLVRQRQILAAKATRLDSHHFRLELSTQAGTYVKEFVHGDLRRTTPSMASILGYKTNLLELDCEGIQVDKLS